MAKTVIIPGRLHNPEQGNVVTGANEILDDTKGKKQNVINSEVDAELVRLDNSKQDNLTFDSTPTENSTNPVTSGGVYAAELTLSQAIEAILLLIPSAASALNKLVDTETMNSSIATATASFKGTYNLVTDLSLGVDATHEQIAAKMLEVITTADNNDYAFVQVPTNAGTPTEIRVTERYKFNGTVWAYEYDLNNSGFTAAQWAAINSGITALLVSKLSELPTATELATALAGKQAVLTFDNAPTQDSDNPVKSGGVYTAIKNETDARELSEQGLQQGINTNAGDISGIKDVLPSGATAANKLVDNNSMVSYVTTLIGGISATFNVTSVDGHITLHITQVDGEITSVTLTTSDIASAAALNLKASQADLEALTSVVNTKAAQTDLTTLACRVSVNETDISNLQAAYATAMGQSHVIVGAKPASGQADIIYRVPGTNSYTDLMYYNGTWYEMATYNNAIDDVPTNGSNNLVKSGGVYEVSMLPKEDVSNFFDLNIIHSGNCLIDSGGNHSVATMPSSVGYCRVTEPIALPSDKEYLHYNGLWTFNDAQIKCCFYVNSTTTGEAGSEILQIPATTLEGKPGFIPVGKYYRKGFRYIILELTRGLSRDVDLSGIVMSWEDAESVKEKSLDNEKRISQLEANAEYNIFNENVIFGSNALISSSGNYEVVNLQMSTHGYSRVTFPIPIQKNKKYLHYKGLSSYGENLYLSYALYYSDTFSGEEGAIRVPLYNTEESVSAEGYIPLSLYYQQGYRYIIIELTRGSQTAVDLSDIILEWSDSNGEEVAENVYVNRNSQLLHPSTSPRKACVIFQYDFGVWQSTIPQFLNILKDAGIDEMTINAIPTALFPSYATHTQKWVKEGHEIALHGNHADDADFANNLNGYLQTMYSYGIEPKGFIELSTQITPANLVIAKDYFQWIIKRDGDYLGYGDVNYLASVNTLTDKPYELKRLSIEMYHEDHSDASKVTELINHAKAAIDKAIEDKGLLVFYLHYYNITSGTPYTLYPEVLDAILNYLKTKMQVGICVTGRTDEVVDYYYTKRYNE